MDFFLPCQSYLIRHIKNNDGLLFYAKMYFSSCEKKGFSTDEALLMYKATVTSMLPKDRPQLFVYHGEELSDDDFILAVRTDTALPKAPPCHKYCKDVLGSNDLCKTCQYYHGYANGNINLQYSLLKYVLLSQDNYLSVEGQIEVPRKVFTGYTDLLMNLNEPEPFAVPMLLNIYKAIRETRDVLYASGTLESRLGLLRDTAVKLLTGSSKSGKYDAINSIPPERFEKIWQILCLDIANAGDMSLAEAEGFLSGTGEKKLPVLEAPEPDVLFNVGDRLFQTVSGYVEVSGEAGTPEPPVQKNEDDSVEEPLSGGEEDRSEPSSKCNDSEADPAGARDNSGYESVPPVAGNAGPDGKGEENGPASAKRPETGKDKETASDRTEHKETREDPLYIAPCSSLTFSDPENIENDSLLSRFAPVEVFSDATGGLCFVFLLRGNFYVCRPESPKVKEIMSNRKLVKICWQPFDILSLCVRNDVAARSLYSIMETEISYFNNDICASYWDVCLKYAGNLPSCRPVERHGVGMRYYTRIYSVQSELIKGLPLLPEIHSCFEVLGRSYHRDRKIKNGGRLFSMSCNGRIVFSDRCKFRVLSPGYEVGVTVENLNDVSLAELFITMLGRFRTVRFNGLQIVSLVDNELTLYVPGGMYEFVSSYIHVFFDKFAVHTGNMEMRINYRSKYCDPSLPIRYRNRPPQNPGSLMSILDLLTKNSSTPKRGSKKVPEVRKVSLKTLLPGTERSGA